MTDFWHWEPNTAQSIVIIAVCAIGLFAMVRWIVGPLIVLWLLRRGPK